jgi:inner membrane transporter RhtA
MMTRAARSVPAPAWFGLSALFHNLGPAFAVLLFPVMGVLGVAWLRIAAAALVFAPFTRPWRFLVRADRKDRMAVLALGACLALMNCAFYLALERLPISLVSAIEFVGTMGVALYGLRSGRNLLALGLTIVGVVVLIDVRWSSDPIGLLWAAVNGLMFVGYVLIGHRCAEDGAGGGIERLGAAMLIAFVCVSPFGLMEALDAGSRPILVAAGVGVGICSSVVPYVCDQLAMARLSRASFAIMLALLPAFATMIGALVLAQVPTVKDLFGVGLVMAGIALHRPAPSPAMETSKS